MDKALIKKTAIVTATVVVVLWIASMIPTPKLPR